MGGIPLKSIRNFSEQGLKEVIESTKKSGADAIRLKGGAGRAVGVCIKHVVESMVLDIQSLLPVSSPQSGSLELGGENYDLSGVSLSLPTRVGRTGVISVEKPAISHEESVGLRDSAESLREVLQGLASAPALSR